MKIKADPSFDTRMPALLSAMQARLLLISSVLLLVAGGIFSGCTSVPSVSSKAPIIWIVEDHGGDDRDFTDQLADQMRSFGYAVSTDKDGPPDGAQYTLRYQAKLVPEGSKLYLETFQADLYYGLSEVGSSSYSIFDRSSEGPAGLARDPSEKVRPLLENLLRSVPALKG